MTNFAPPYYNYIAFGGGGDKNYNIGTKLFGLHNYHNE